ncbi:hypothetical protein COY17_03130 [Candidatus Saccharibacteria bacterium CG_4_10_14_0_2_um_filter_52_9]|nr:MAG: hypothetical protein COY17_03130 [Candidatus Saccharibacteria bacterium CG_4_10_14_0_2_um_filter_52_9]
MLNKLTLKKSKLEQSNQGFTIIEVMIVLAIAGLIMLIVFLAVPSLQRNSRNTQRKNDVGSLLSALSEYVSNNNGQLPATCNGTTASCFIKETKLSSYDNATANISFTKNTSATSLANPNNFDKVTILSFAKCDKVTVGAAVNTNASSRNVVALYTLETQSGQSPQCQET